MTVHDVSKITSENYGFRVYDYDQKLSLLRKEKRTADAMCTLGHIEIAFESKPTAAEAAERFNEIFQKYKPNHADMNGKTFKPLCVALRLCDDDTIPLKPLLAIFGEQENPPFFPAHLYKIISKEDWEKSQQQGFIEPADTELVTLATEDQAGHEVQKLWQEKEHVIVKLATKKLDGRLTHVVKSSGTRYY